MPINSSKKPPKVVKDPFPEEDEKRLERIEKTFTLFITALIISQSIYLTLSQEIFGPSVDLRLLLRPTFIPLFLGIALWAIGKMSPHDNIRTTFNALAWTPIFQAALLITVGGFLSVVLLDLAFILVPADVGILGAFFLAPYQSELMITLYDRQALAAEKPLHNRAKLLVHVGSRALMVLLTTLSLEPWLRFHILGVQLFGADLGPWIGQAGLIVTGLLVSYIPWVYSKIRTRYFG